jgi:molybdenum cofactor cytidylyltransferase
MARLEGSVAVLLAAGLSRRFGGPGKLVAAFRDEPLALHAARAVAALPFQRHVAVCRDDDDALALMLGRLGLAVVRNSDPVRGLASSLALGVEAAGDAEAVLVCLADMPLVTGAHLRTVVERVGPAGIVASVPARGEAPGPPAAFARERLPELRELTGDKGARHLLQGAELVLAPAGTLADFDTPEDIVRGQ